MIKKTASVICLSLLVIIFILTGCSSLSSPTTQSPATSTAPTTSSVPATTTSSSVKPITLRFASFQPSSGSQYQTETWFMSEVEKRTNGRVKIEGYWSESLLSAKELLTGVQNGTADMAIIFPSNFATQLPLANVGNIWVRPAIDTLTKVKLHDEYFKDFPAVQDEAKKYNQKTLFVYNSGSLGMVSTKPIKTLADFKGLTVRCPNAAESESLAAAGANTVNMPTSESYQAMQQGAFDAAWMTFPGLKTWGFHEIGKNIINVNRYTGNFYLFTVNLDTWAKLPQDLQQIIEQVGRETENQCANLVIADEKKALDAFTASGCTYTVLPSTEVQKWRDLIESKLVEKWVKDSRGEDRQGAVKVYQALIEKYLPK